jgi:flagellar hook-basal body complex protein FliE
MTLPISAVGSAASAAAPAAAGAPASPAPAGFAESLGRLVGSVEESSATANQAVGRMLDGSGDVHDAMIALQRAELSLQLTVQVRNKLVQAYQDIMRMPV